MGRNPKFIGNHFTIPTSSENIQKTLFLVKTGNAAEVHEFNFIDGSISYFEVNISQTFEYVLVDNIGDNDIRISFNRLGINLSNPINGAKTLKTKDSLYIQDSIKNITIYFIGDSIVELILISE